MYSGYIVLASFDSIYYNFSKAFLINGRYMLYLYALGNTLKMAAMATVLGIIIGLLVASVKVSREGNIVLKVIAKIFDLYTTIIRGTPVLLQILIMWTAVFTSRSANPIFVGGLCLGINSGAYVSEIFRGAINSVDKGQTEAGRSLGLSHYQTMKSIIIPQAFKNAIPALGNEFVMLIKETSVVSVISAMELIKVAQGVGNSTWDFTTPLIIVGLIYLAIVLIIQKFQSKLERRLERDA